MSRRCVVEQRQPSSNEFEEAVIDARRCDRHDLHRTAVIGRTDVKNLIFGWVGEPKHLVDIFRNLPEALLAGAQIFFGLPLCRHVQMHDHRATRMIVSQRCHRQ